MSEQNPWKKQMMMNRNQINTTQNSTSQVNQSPPWMKKNQQTNNNVSSSNQPSWMKNKEPTNNSQPAWMKNNSESTNSNNNSTTPAWMQNRNNQQHNNVPAWKAGGTAFGAEKKKQQEQERLKKQQQEKDRLKRQEQQKRQAQKLKEKQNEQRQTKLMQMQDQLSKKRQAFDLERQRQLRRLQEQKKRLEEQEMKNKRFQSNRKDIGSSSKKRLHSSIKMPPPAQSPLYIKFLHYFEQSLNPSLDYKQRIAQQKQLIKISKQFSTLISKQIIQLVNQKIQGNSKILSQQKKNKIVNMQNLNTQIYYALCEGQQRETEKNDSTQSIQNSIKFDMSSIEKLEKVFTFYNVLCDIFCSLSKKQPSSILAKFRIPLFTFLQYKGIAFLCQAYTKQILSVQSVLPSQYKEISNQFAVIEKQLKQKYHCQIGKNDIFVKKVFVNEIQEEIYIFYLKNWNLKFSNNSKDSSKATIQQLTTDYYFLSNFENQKRLSLIQEVEFQTFKKVRTHAFIEMSDVVLLAQCIFIVYSSCQGQVEQKQFWQLILSQSEQIWALIRSAGYKGKLHQNKRFLFKIFQALSGVKIKFEYKKSSKKQKLKMKQSNCLISEYGFLKLQVNEVIKNFQKYLKENKLQLAEQSLLLMKELQQLNHEKQKQNSTDGILDNQDIREKKQKHHQKSSISCLIKNIKFLVAQSKFSQAVQILQNLISNDERFKNKGFVNIPIRMQLLVLYIKMRKQSKVLKNFKELLEIVQFYYGPQSLLNATLYQMLASYYSLASKNSSDPRNLQTHIITLYEHAFSILIRYYGDQSEQIAQLYLSRAVSFLNLKNYELFNRDIEHSLRIFKTHSRQKQKIAQCLFYKGRQRIENQNFIDKSQGIQFIEQSASIYMKLFYYSEAIDAYLLVIQMLDQKKEQNTKKIQTYCNFIMDTLLNNFKSTEHLGKAVKIILQKVDLEVFNMVQKYNAEKDQQNLKNQENSVTQQIQIQEQIFQDLKNVRKGFQNFTEIIKWLHWNSSLFFKPQNYQSQSKERFDEIINILGKILELQNKKLPKIQGQTEEQIDQQNNSNHSRTQRQSEVSSQIQNNQFDSPIKKFSKKSSIVSDFSQPEDVNQ